jgi:hypothetical protein
VAVLVLHSEKEENAFQKALYFLMIYYHTSLSDAILAPTSKVRAIVMLLSTTVGN